MCMHTYMLTHTQSNDMVAASILVNNLPKYQTLHSGHNILAGGACVSNAEQQILCESLAYETIGLPGYHNV